MMLANPELRVVLVTVHMPLREALDSITAGLVEQTLLIANQSLQKFGVAKPKLAVAGINPHAGEDGLFGDEETRILAPAIAAAQRAGVQASGPYPPDTIFMRARGLQEFDAVVAMYHDQGLIPVKYLGVEQGVNVTLGLPFVRTSPDHGTAFNIAGQGIADPASMVAALKMAHQLSELSRDVSE
jgi:4-hydroxythreonine-4-phosphate dehydrogenase